MPSSTTAPIKRVAASAALFASIALSLPGSAAAQATGRTTVGALGYTLTDLDPLDGITPSLQFRALPFVPPPGEEVEGARLFASYLDGDVSEYAERFGSATDTLAQAYQPNDSVSISATLSGRGQVQDHQISILAFANTDGSATRNAYATMHTGRLEFELSPNTAVVFDLTVDVEASIREGLAFNEFYQSSVNLYVAIGPVPFTGFDEAFGSYTAHAAPEFGGLTTLDITETLRVSYENRSGSPVSGFTSFDAWGQAVSGPLPPPIPEPAQLPMLATGLLLAGLWQRSRSRRSA